MTHPRESGRSARRAPSQAPAGDLDVLVIGAGLSGICAAYHLRTGCPGRSFAILEARAGIGGTWDLFRYPGVRSDSDVQTLGYGFHPWRGERSITDGPSILAYIREAAEAHGLMEAVRLRHRAVAASWDTAAARWTVEVEVGTPGGGTRRTAIRCRYLFVCTGYYDYEGGHAPSWPGMQTYGGRIVHPQSWPADLEVKDRRIAVIGSGATAVTLVPALAESAASVTMVQRTPSYMTQMPSRDGIADWFSRRLPARAAHGLVRWKNVLMGIWVYQLARRAPRFVRRKLIEGVREAVGPDRGDERDYTPPYAPWDQRLCLVPDGDLFDAIREGRARIVTGRIERFTPAGLLMEDGREVGADVIVTATGLRVKLAGGMRIEVDGAPVETSELHTYKGAMFAGVPNLSIAMGYTNASWTLKCELIARHVVRLLNHMDERGHDWACPEPPPPGTEDRPFVPLASGYISRAAPMMPQQTARAPWRVEDNYISDLRRLRYGRLTDRMRFGRAADAARTDAA